MTQGLREQKWWKSAVVYQVYPRSFADSDGDGIGDLAGLIGRLDHIAALGADVIWLCPVYRSPQVDNGYDISDYQDVDPLFGTLADFDRLLAAVHERGMRLVMDLVVNHTSDQHPWFHASRSGTGDKRDWYYWRDQPNNWGSVFGGPAWTYDEDRKQWYLHLFAPQQPDLNWENPQVRQAVYEMMRWWLDRGVDGFRMDVVNFLSKAPGLPDAPAVPGKDYVNAFSLFADGPRMHEWLHELNAAVLAGREGTLTVGEMPGVTVGEALLYTDPARAEVDMVFQFEHMALDVSPEDKYDYLGLDLVRLKQVMHRWQTGLTDPGWNSLYWNNHDQPRVVSRFGDDDPEWWRASATALGTVLHGMRGTPYVYQGEELGMTNYPFVRGEEYRDTEAVTYYRHVVAAGLNQGAALKGLAKISRDNARTPMQWSADPGAGFTTGTPWLPVNPDHSWLNAETQVGIPGTVFSHYQALIRLRHEQPVLVDGDFTPLYEDDLSLWGYARTTAGQRLLVLANCGRGPRTVELDAMWNGAALLLGNHPDTPGVLRTSVELRGWEAGIWLV